MRALTPRHHAMLLLTAKLRVQGGKGSGNFGHAGRRGEIGGSGDASGDTFSKWTSGGTTFHGTAGANLDNILKNGLSMKTATGVAGARAVWTARDIEQAKMYATGKHDAVLEIHVPKGAAFEKTYGSIVFRTKDVPASWIKAVHYPDEAGSWKVRSLEAQSDNVFFITVRLDELQTLGGKGSGNFAHGGRPGQKGGSGDDGTSRKERAVATHKPSTRANQQLAARSVNVVARLTGGVPTDDHKPMDVVVKSSRGVRGIEVKTLIDNTTNQITMHKESLARKEAWIKENKAEGHTIAVDRRGSSPVYYHKEGFGSFRLTNMTRVTSSELKHLVR